VTAANWTDKVTLTLGWLAVTVTPTERFQPDVPERLADHREQQTK